MANDLGNSGFNSELLLSETERKLGPAPRHLDLEERLFLLGCRWVGFQFRRAGDELHLVYESRKRLLREGNVALGFIVQANQELFHQAITTFPLRWFIVQIARCPICWRLSPNARNVCLP